MSDHKAKKETREERLKRRAQALRANLKRRKSFQKKRAEEPLKKK